MGHVKVSFRNVVSLGWPVNFIVVISIELLLINMVNVMNENNECVLTSRRARIRSFSSAV